LIDKVKFSMTELRKAIHRLLETARRRIRVDLMRVGDKDDKGSPRLLKIDLKSIRDTPGVMIEGFNFLELSDND